MTVVQCNEVPEAPRIGHSTGHSMRGAHQSRCTCRRLLRSRERSHKRSQPGEVVGGHRQREYMVNLVQPSDHHLADRPDNLAPAEALLDALSLALAHLVAAMSGRARVDGAATDVSDVLRNMRCDIDVPTTPHECLGVIGFVSPYRDAPAGAYRLAPHRHRRFLLNTEWFHTLSSIESPTNQRNSKL